MSRPVFVSRRNGFTFIELLLAMTLGVLVAAILGVLVHGLLTAGDNQAERLRGPTAARAVLRSLSRELTCAFAPPVQDLPPLELTTSTEPGKPEVRLAFYAPVPDPSAPADGYDIHHVAYEVHRTERGRKELRRLAAPCSGPFTNAPVTNRLLQGGFALSIEALTNETAHTEWPLPDHGTPALPPSMRLSLAWDDAPPFQTEVLIQSATGIRSPIERPAVDAPPPEEQE